jgi:hypothetical protein
MASYTIIIQPADNSGDHWLESHSAAKARAFAKWLHKATGAAIAVHDFNKERDMLTLGAFDEART